MSWVQSLQSMLPRPERRGDGEIDDDLADEFAFHLQQSEREIVASGEKPEAARAIARRRFGDVEEITRRCRRIALEERIMLQRFNAVMMVLVGVLVAGLAVQVWIMQRDNAGALREITGQLAKLKTTGPAAPEAAPAKSADAEKSGKAIVEGDVARPGWYPIEQDGGAVLLNDLIRQVRPIDPTSTVFVEPGRRVYTVLELESQYKVLLRAGDRITVSSPATIERRNGGGSGTRTEALRPGIWRQVDASGGAMAGDGAVMQVVGVSDVMNLSGCPIGRLELAGHHELLELEFTSGGSQNLQIYFQVRKDGQRSQVLGRWNVDAGRLSINIAPAVSSMTTPLYFQWAEEAPAVSATRPAAAALGASNQPPAGVWREIDEAGQVVETGARLVVMDGDDARNPRKIQGGVLTLVSDGEEIGVTFKPIDARPANMTVMQGTPQAHRTNDGLWSIDERGLLVFNAAEAFVGRDEPLRFKRTGDVPAAAYAAEPASNGGLIYLMGDVTRPGAYSLPAMGELSLRRLIASAGGAKDAGPIEVRVSSMNPAGERTERYRHEDFLGDPAADILVLPGDLVEVTLGDKPAPADAAAEAAREKARADAVAAFLREMLVVADPDAPQVKMQDVLDRAARQVETSFADQPEVQAQLRAVIEENRKRSADNRKSSATTRPAGKP